MPMFPFDVSARAVIGAARHRRLFWEEVLATVGFTAALMTALIVVFGTIESERINLLTHVSFALLTVALFGFEVTFYRHWHSEPPEDYK